MNLQVKIKNGYDLLASGSFIAFDDNSTIEFNLISDEGPLVLSFIFIDDKKDKDVRISSELNSNDNNLKLKLYNYRDKRNTIKPWLIGVLYNRELYMHFIIDPSHKTLPRKINYSFYLGKEISNGEI